MQQSAVFYGCLNEKRHTKEQMKSKVWIVLPEFQKPRGSFGERGKNERKKSQGYSDILWVYGQDFPTLPLKQEFSLSGFYVNYY